MVHLDVEQMIGLVYEVGVEPLVVLDGYFWKMSGLWSVGGFY